MKDEGHGGPVRATGVTSKAERQARYGMAYGIGCLDFTSINRAKVSTLRRKPVAPKVVKRRRIQDREIIPVLVSHNGGMTYKPVMVREGFVRGAKVAYYYSQVRKVEKLGQ